MKHPEPSGIKSVGFYVASPVEMCDRCGQGIKLVSVVNMVDGIRFKYGCECIEKILAGDNSLRSLYNRNLKLLRKYQRYLEILSLPEDQLPFENKGYYNRGVYMIADDSGRALCFEHYFFHPLKVDDSARAQMNGAVEHICFGSQPFGTCWVANTYENWGKRCRAEIEAGKAKLEKEIDRLQKFLGRVLAKGLLSNK